mgnify:CR=1 FL=1
MACGQNGCRNANNNAHGFSFLLWISCYLAARCLARHGKGPLASLMDTVLSVEAARAHYDALGQGQDREMRYAEAAFSRLIGAVEFSAVRSVVELGPGTGMLAARLLRDCLAPEATWLGLDVSPGMRELAAERLGAFGDRVRLDDCSGDGRLALPDASTDLVVATYVLDLLSPAAITRFLEDAARILKPGGQLAVVTLHSVEDRMVKRFLTARSGGGGNANRFAPEMTRAAPQFRVDKRKAIGPDAEELAENPRSRSAKLRVAIRTDAPSGTVDEKTLGMPMVRGL